MLLLYFLLDFVMHGDSFFDIRHINRVWGGAATIAQTTRTLSIVKPAGAVTSQRAEIKIKGSYI